MANVDTHPNGTVCWFDLMASDPGKARAFYAALFGWTFEIGGPETGGYGMAKLDDRNVAGVGAQPPGAGFPSTWNVYFSVENADATAEKIKANGGNVVMGPMDVMDEGRLAFCVDPTGAHFGIWQPRNHKGMQKEGEPGSRAWQEVNTRDAAKARAFYGQVLGLEAKKLEGMDYWTLHQGDSNALAGILQMDEHWPAHVPPHWMAYFYVADTDATCAKVRELGGEVFAPPFDTPYGRIAVLTDPVGAAFSVVKPPA